MMKQFLKRGVLLLLAVLLVCSSGARGSEAGTVLEQVLAEEIARAGAADAQGWVDSTLGETVDGTGGWYLMALSWLQAEDPETGVLLGGLDGSRALEILRERAQGENLGVTKRERMALTFQALGAENPFIGETIALAREESTLMPLVFGLHLMNNQRESDPAARGEMAERILALQLSDGGWAVIGEEADVDCTAMALQALAPLAGTPEMDAAIDRGLAALSGIQQENGGFLGMGLESAESCAQVVMALTSLGIDPEADARFLKRGHSVLEAMLRFRLPGEGFAHDLKSGKRNDTATMQCFSALVSLRALRSGKGGPYYVFPAWKGAAPGAGRAWQGLPLGTWALMAAGLVALCGWILAAVRRKRNWRSYAFPALLGLLIACAGLAVEIQSPEAYYGATETQSGERDQETFVAILCDTVAGENAYAPADGVILGETAVMLAQGETAFDQLLEATRANRIQMEYDGTVAGAYVRGIGYLYEYEFGNLSGWMYRVNGEFADVGCSQYALAAGDRVEWVYTLNLGRDAEKE